MERNTQAPAHFWGNGRMFHRQWPQPRQCLWVVGHPLTGVSVLDGRTALRDTAEGKGILSLAACRT